MITPNMNLDLPTPNETIGPIWAALVNAAFNLIDEHDHTTNKGVPIPSTALDVQGDIDISGFNLDNVRAVRFQNQPGAVPATGSDIRMVYVREGELYYNDASGNQVRITLNGSVDVSATGAIAGLTSPASAEYSTVTNRFTWSQNTNQRASMAFGSAILADPSTASSNTITLQTPASGSIPGSYSITLPAAPPGSGVRFLQMNTSGVLTNVTGDAVLNDTTSAHVMPEASARKVLSQANRSILAGDGLTGGGNLSANRTITMGTPSSITSSSTNSVTASSHTHALSSGTIGVLTAGIGYNGVGSYAFGLMLDGGSVTQGSTRAGSTINIGSMERAGGSFGVDGRDDMGATRGSASLLGCWRAMGRNQTGSGRSLMIHQRIS